MNNQLYCPDETRKALIAAEKALNAIDYLEVLDQAAPAGSPRQQTLLVHCFLPAAGLSREQVRIEGGVRVSPVRVLWAHPANNVPAGLLSPAEQAYLAALEHPDRILVVRTDRPGDFATYTLRLIFSATQPQDPPNGFDPVLSAVEFSFKVECPTPFDCRKESAAVESLPPAPPINYLAKDYASFRRLLLDRLSLLLPNVDARHPASLLVTLAEALAYAGDHLSYYQDAVATEAYLGTARRRTSLRRHARLLDYFLSDGCNARAWVCVEVEQGTPADGGLLPAGTRVWTGDAKEMSRAAAVFEALHDVRLKWQRNSIPFYTWRNTDCCLPQGATRAALAGSAADLTLEEGDVLVFEEVLGPASGRPEDADLSRRHAVRLSQTPVERTDPSNNQKVLEIAWRQDDGLPFCLSLRSFDDGSGKLLPASVARGNIVLAAHGQRVEKEELPSVVTGERYRPVLKNLGLTHAAPYEHDRARRRAAAAALQQEERDTLPWIVLEAQGETWSPQRDLLNSDRFALEFVVEMEEGGRAGLRFGDDILGRQPAAGTQIRATYRVGQGLAGNVGAEALTHVESGLAGIRRVRNPLPARGGADPEPLERVRQHAPHSFRTQERAVTAADWADAAQRHPEVQRATASRRWTGSWHTWFLTVDRKGGRLVDASFKTELRGFLDPFRLAGYDLDVDAPHFVPLEIELMVCVAPGHYSGAVHEELLRTFSAGDLRGGKRGFFHPDNFTFAQPVYLSQIVAAAMQVPGVAWVQPVLFQRWGEKPRGEKDEGVITFDRLEIARLDSDPNAPENGRIRFSMQGGL